MLPLISSQKMCSVCVDNPHITRQWFQLKISWERRGECENYSGKLFDAKCEERKMFEFSTFSLLSLSICGYKRSCEGKNRFSAGKTLCRWRTSRCERLQLIWYRWGFVTDLSLFLSISLSYFDKIYDKYLVSQLNSSFVIPCSNFKVKSWKFFLCFWFFQLRRLSSRL